VDMQGKSNTNVHNCMSDPSGRFLVSTVEQGGTPSVHDAASGERVHTLDSSTHTAGIAFNDAGTRVAFFDHGKDASGRGDGAFSGHAVLCDPTDGWRELQRIPIPDVPGGNIHWAEHLQFAPGNDRFLLVASSLHGGTVLIIDCETGEEPDWSKVLRTMALPAGKLSWQSIRWAAPDPSSEQAAAEEDDTGTSALSPMILQAAVDSQLYLIDVSAFIRTFEQDVNFSIEQLNRLSDSNPDSIPILLEKWPHVINFRDDATGDTVLHHCARAENPKATEKWLSGSVPYTPLDNANERSALREAIDKQQLDTARELMRLLDPQLTLARTQHITNDLVAIAEKWPRQLVEFVRLFEETCMFRDLRRLPVLKKQLEDFDVRSSIDGRAWQCRVGHVRG
jgi:hypothetical protein